MCAELELFLKVQKPIKPHNCGYDSGADYCVRCVAHMVDPYSTAFHWELVMRLFIISLLLVFIVPLFQGCAWGTLKETRLYEKRECSARTIPDAKGPYWWYNKHIEMDACK